MATNPQERALFPGRATYPNPGRIPDRSTIPNPPPFGTSAMSRRPEQGGPQTRAQPSQPHHGAGGDKDASPLNELSEEQKEEVNEAVSLPIYIVLELCALRPLP